MNRIRSDLTHASAKLAELAEVLRGAGTGRVLVLCHNNPDPDTLASAAGFSFLLSRHFGVRSIIGHGGVVTRAENKAMIHRLRIKVTQMARLDPGKYFGIALIDGQPGTGNNLVESRSEPPLIVIDHHPLRKLSLKARFHDIRPSYGATSTIITEYIAAAGLTPTRSVANALLYGIKTDTNALGRGAERPDFNAFSYLSPLTNPRVVGWIERPCLPLSYFEDFERGLARTRLCRDVVVSYLGKMHSESIVPELADLLLRIEGVSWSLCMGEHKNLLILSLRSTSRTYQADRVIRRLVGKAGPAGGHRGMAGSSIPLSGLSRAEKEELPKKLVEKLLRIIGRKGAQHRPLVPPGASANRQTDW